MQKDQALKNVLFIIIGPSGSGKTRVTAAVFPQSYKIISHTTRKRRAGEKNGVDYYFETKASFKKLLEKQSLAEYDSYQGNYYGVGLATIFEKTETHCAYDVLTFKGFQQIEALFGAKIIPIFFDVSREKVKSRLNLRESDPTIINQRLALYDAEIKAKSQIDNYANSVILNANGEFNDVVQSLKKILQERQ